MATTKHTLPIEGNAFDSLNEGLRKYRAGKRGERGAYKFAVQHIAHFMELYFKYQVSKRHELLIYRNPFRENVRESFTITLDDAIQFLINDNATIPDSLRADLLWLKRLRNSIEHSAFEFEPKEVRHFIGRLSRAVEEFAVKNNCKSVRKVIDAENADTYAELTNEYAQQIAEVQIAIVEEGLDPKECYLCMTAAVAVEERAGVRCRFCHELDAHIMCAHCGSQYRRSRVYGTDQGLDTAVVQIFCEQCGTWRQVYDLSKE